MAVNMNLNSIAALKNTPLTPLKGGIAGCSTFQIRSYYDSEA